MTKPKQATCIYNANRKTYKTDYPICTWKPQKELRPPHMTIGINFHLNLYVDCHNCKAYKKEEVESTDKVKLNLELDKIDCHNLEMIIRSQIDRNNGNMLDCIATKNEFLFKAYKRDNEYIEELIKKMFKKD